MANEMLEEIETESLLHLFTSFTSVQVRTGISALDEYTAAMDIAYQGQVIEIQGPPATGKTHLIYFILVTCITPPTFEAIPLEGWGRMAFVHDTDYNFDMVRLKTILCERLSQKAVPEACWPSLIESCFSRVYVFRPTSTLALAASLRSARNLMSSRLRNNSLGLVVVDSISAFSCQDDLACDIVSEDDDTAEHAPEDSSPNALEQVAEALQWLRLSFAPLILLSNWAILPNESEIEEPPFYGQHLEPFPSLDEAAEEAEDIFSVSLHITTAVLDIQKVQKMEEGDGEWGEAEGVDEREWEERSEGGWEEQAEGAGEGGSEKWVEGEGDWDKQVEGEWAWDEQAEGEGEWAWDEQAEGEGEWEWDEQAEGDGEWQWDEQAEGDGEWQWDEQAEGDGEWQWDEQREAEGEGVCDEQMNTQIEGEELGEDRDNDCEDGEPEEGEQQEKWQGEWEEEDECENSPRWFIGYIRSLKSADIGNVEYTIGAEGIMF